MRKRSPRPDLPKKRARTTTCDSSGAGSSDAFTCAGFLREALSAGPLASARRDSGRAVLASKLESKVILLDNTQSKGSASASFGAVRLRERRRQVKDRPRLSRRQRRALGLDPAACFNVKGGACDGVVGGGNVGSKSSRSAVGSSPLALLKFADTVLLRRLWASYFAPLLQGCSAAARDDAARGTSIDPSISAHREAQVRGRAEEHPSSSRT